MKNVILLFVLLLNVFCQTGLAAQKKCQTGLAAQEKFDLEQRGGHFYFAADINETPVELMLESGIPALLVGDGFYESCLKSSDLSFQESKGKMRLLNDTYDIVCRADGEISIGNALYVGPVFVLKDYEGISVPVQYLKDAVTRRSVVTIDLKNKFLLVGQSEKKSAEKKSAGKKSKLSFDKDLGFPVISAKIHIDSPEGKSKLKGSLVVDFGNPALLFLRKQHKSIGKAVEKNTIKLRDAYDRKGNLIAQGIYANTVSIFGNKYNDISIGVTDKMQNLSHLGFLGLPFFLSQVVFDFDRGYMYY